MKNVKWDTESWLNGYPIRAVLRPEGGGGGKSFKKPKKLLFPNSFFDDGNFAATHLFVAA